jgi:hypothetical protein
MFRSSYSRQKKSENRSRTFQLRTKSEYWGWKRVWGWEERNSLIFFLGLFPFFNLVYLFWEVLFAPPEFHTHP